jgi:hypothetical protein
VFFFSFELIKKGRESIENSSHHIFSVYSVLGIGAGTTNARTPGTGFN